MFGPVLHELDRSDGGLWQQLTAGDRHHTHWLCVTECELCSRLVGGCSTAALLVATKAVRTLPDRLSLFDAESANVVASGGHT